METSESCRVDPFTDLINVNASFSHQSSVIESVLHWAEPVTDMKSGKVSVPCAPFDLILEVLVPPGVVNVNGNADTWVVVEIFTYLISLFHAINGRTIRCI